MAWIPTFMNCNEYFISTQMVGTYIMKIMANTAIIFVFGRYSPCALLLRLHPSVVSTTSVIQRNWKKCSTDYMKFCVHLRVCVVCMCVHVRVCAHTSVCAWVCAGLQNLFQLITSLVGSGLRKLFVHINGYRRCNVYYVMMCISPSLPWLVKIKR